MFVRDRENGGSFLGTKSRCKGSNDPLKREEYGAEPPRRVELPRGGLRDRCTTVVRRGRVGAGYGYRARRGLCGAQACHHEQPAWWCRRGRHRCCESPWRVEALRPVTRSSRPLESNQNLPGFNRARRPPTRKRDTSAAACWKHTRGARSSSSSSSVVRDRTLAVRGAHLGRRCARCLAERTCHDSRSVFRSRFADSCIGQWQSTGGRPCDAENVEGPLGVPAALRAAERG